jgi:heme/copper-type cytochrome/quinol oxidase subunit 2
MNPHFRKAALIAASLGLLVSLYFALNPRDDDGEAGPATTAATTTAATESTTTEQATTEVTTPESTTTAPATTEPPPTTTAPAQPEVITIRIAVGPEGVESIRRFSVRKGREVEIVVRSALTDHVHVHGYDLMADVAPGAPATIRFTADVPGRFEIELEDRGLPIAELEVRP